MRDREAPPRDLTWSELDRLRIAAYVLAARVGGSLEAAVEQVEAFAAVREGVSQPAAPGQLRALLRVRARRNQRLSVRLFRDPAWDMLLTLLLAAAERRPVSVSSLCFASGVPATTALRYVERMADDGLLIRSGDLGDHRRVLVEIDPARRPAVEALLRELRDSLANSGDESGLAEMGGDD